VFVQDTTGSLQPYIDACVARCKDVCIALQGSGQIEELRLAVVAFRDHFPGDKYVTKDFDGFTNDVDTAVSNLSTLKAHGGEDGPEAITTALDKTLKLKWRRGSDVVRIAVLITDAPPHGIGERDDLYPHGEPNGMLARNFRIKFIQRC
jgi:Mg-chelatase subunit ChlD